MSKKINITREKLYELYWDRGLSIRKIARKLGVGKTTVEYWLKKYKIPRRTPPQKDKLSNLTKEELYDLYWNKGLSLSEIAKMFDVNKSSVKSKMMNLGIPTEKNRRKPRWKHINLSPSPTLAYILGVILGDGSVYARSRGDKAIALNTIDKPFAEAFYNALKEIGLNPKIYTKMPKDSKLKTRYYVETCSKEFYDWFNRLTKEDIRKIALAYPKEFIRGFYESEGCLTKYTKPYGEYYSIQIANTVEWKIDLIVELLRNMGFRVYKNKYKRDYVKTGLFLMARIHRQEDVRRFLELINPCIKK